MGGEVGGAPLSVSSLLKEIREFRERFEDERGLLEHGADEWLRKRFPGESKVRTFGVKNIVVEGRTTNCATIEMPDEPIRASHIFRARAPRPPFCKGTRPCECWWHGYREGLRSSPWLVRAREKRWADRRSV